MSELMTMRQLSELLAKGYGEAIPIRGLMVTSSFIYPTEAMEKDFIYPIEATEKDLAFNSYIRPWNSLEWRKPTIDIYNDYMSKWNKAFGEKPVHLENREEYTKGIVHNECSKAFDEMTGKPIEQFDGLIEEVRSWKYPIKRTPQEIADFFGIYVAKFEIGDWVGYAEEPEIYESKSGGEWHNEDWICDIELSDLLIETPPNHDWHTLYRPHAEPIIVKEENE